ncbi:MAG: hypothetical protein ACR2HQ_04105 [Ilumatobacteraceae bacterium]
MPPGSVDDEDDEDGPQLPVLLAAGAVPHPAGSLGALAAAGSDEPAQLLEDAAGAEADAGDDRSLSRFKNAVMSLPVGTTATTSHPSPDFSVSLAASVDASNVETLTESNSYMVVDDNNRHLHLPALSPGRHVGVRRSQRAATSSRSAPLATPS